VSDLLHQIGFSALLSVVISFSPLVIAVAYAVWPTERKLALARATSLATIFGAIGGMLIGGAMVLKALAVSGPHVEMSIVYLGLAEAVTPAFVSFGILATSWLLIAGGILRRS
jgi:hypothetical protein